MPPAKAVARAHLLGEPVRSPALAGILLGVAAVAYGTVLGHRPAGTQGQPTPSVPPS